MKIVKIKKCTYKEYEGMEVKAHYIFSNGINFITRIGMVLYQMRIMMLLQTLTKGVEL